MRASLEPVPLIQNTKLPEIPLGVALGNFYAWEAGSEDFFCKVLLNGIFTMHEENLFCFRRVLAAEPMQQIIIIAVGTHAADLSYLGIHFMELSVDIYFLGMVL